MGPATLFNRLLDSSEVTKALPVEAIVGVEPPQRRLADDFTPSNRLLTRGSIDEDASAALVILDDPAISERERLRLMVHDPDEIGRESGHNVYAVERPRRTRDCEWSIPPPSDPAAGYPAALPPKQTM